MASRDEGGVKLLGTWSSPFVMRPRIALNLKNVEYEFLVETVGSKSELLLKSNPVYGKIPVLLHRDLSICESLIIVQYINDAWPRSRSSILPSDPYGRAVARFWATYIDETWFPMMMRAVKAQSQEEKMVVGEQIHALWHRLEEVFMKCSEGKGFFNGTTLGYLDIAIGSYLSWLGALEMMMEDKFLDDAKTPLLVGWAERFRSHADVKMVMPEAAKLLELAKVVQARESAVPANN